MQEIVLELDGRLETSVVPAFQHQLAEVSLIGNEKLLLDMSRVSFIGSAALRVILMTAKRLAGSGGKLAICAPPQVAQVFAVAGLDAVVAVHLNMAQARAALTA